MLAREQGAALVEARDAGCSEAQLGRERWVHHAAGAGAGRRLERAAGLLVGPAGLGGELGEGVVAFGGEGGDLLGEGVA